MEEYATEHPAAKCRSCGSESDDCYRPSGHRVFGGDWHMVREDDTAILNMHRCGCCAEWVKTKKLVLT